MLANGSWQGQIKDGDYIQLTTMDGYTYKMYFNINTYQYGYDGKTCENPHIDMIGDYLIPTSSALRSSNGNNGNTTSGNPFKASDTIIPFLNNYLDNIPSTLKSHIVNKGIQAPKRYTSGVTDLTDENGYVIITLPKLWIPFGTEVQGTTGIGNSYNSTYELYLRQYHHFKNPLNRIKKKNGQYTANYWWLASASVGVSGSFCYIGAYGGLAGQDPSHSYGVPLCFRFR